MRSSVSQSPDRRRAALAAFALVALAVVALGGSSEARAASEDGSDVALARSANPYADRFPNVVLKTHEGRNVRFYDDLLEGKIVLINFFYVTCRER